MSRRQRDLVNDNDLFDPNKSMRMPIYICIDSSNEMNRYSEQLKEALEMLLNDILADGHLNSCVELGIYVFSSNVTKVRETTIVKDIESAALTIPIDMNCKSPELGLCLEQCMKDIRRKQGDYNIKRVNYYQPHIIVFGASEPLIDNKTEEVIARIISKQKNKEIFVIPIVIGEGNIEVYKQISENEQVYRGYIFDLKDIFKTVKSSMNKLTQTSTTIYHKLNSMVTDWNKYLK